MDLGSAGMETPRPEWAAGPFVCLRPPGHKRQAASFKRQAASWLTSVKLRAITEG